MCKSKGLYTAFVLCAGALWGFTGIFVRYFSALGLTSAQTAVCRSASTVLLLALYLLITDRKKLRIRLRDIWLFMLMGLCSVAAFNFCYFNSILKLGSMSVASVLLYTSPVFVTILSAVFFREKITLIKAAAVILTFAGCVLISGVSPDGITLSVSGIAFGIGAGLSYALYSIFGKFALGKNYSPLTVVFYMWLFGFIFTLPLTDAVTLVNTIQSSPVSVGLLFLFGLISAVLPYALYTLGLKHVSPATAAILSTTEPCVASVIGVCLYKEPLTFSLCVGFAAIITSVVLVNIKSRNKLNTVTQK